MKWNKAHVLPSYWIVEAMFESATWRIQGKFQEQSSCCECIPAACFTFVETSWSTDASFIFHSQHPGLPSSPLILYQVLLTPSFPQSFRLSHLLCNVFVAHVGKAHRFAASQSLFKLMLCRNPFGPGHFLIASLFCRVDSVSHRLELFPFACPAAVPAAATRKFFVFPFRFMHF